MHICRFKLTLTIWSRLYYLRLNGQNLIRSRPITKNVVLPGKAASIELLQLEYRIVSKTGRLKQNRKLDQEIRSALLLFLSIDSCLLWSRLMLVVYQSSCCDAVNLEVPVKRRSSPTASTERFHRVLLSTSAWFPFSRCLLNSTINQ